MTVKTGQAWAGTFVTLDSTGALAAGTPSGVLYVDGTANGATVTITGSNPYKWAVTLPSLTAGQRVDMYITATIATIATAGIVASEQADTVLLSDGVMLADDAITAAKFDESTAFPLKAADTGSTQVARTGADGDTLKTLSDEIATVKTDTAAILVDTGTTLDGLIKDVPTVAEFNARTKLAADYFDPAADTVANVTAVGTTTNLTNLPTMPADWVTASGLKADAVAEIQAGLALEATLTAIKGVGWTTETLAAIDALIDAIKAKTDNLPASPAPANEYDTELAAIQADLNNPDQYKADVSGIPAAVWGYATRTLSSFGTLISDIWSHATRTLSAFGFTVATQSDANVTAIKAKTDNLPAIPAPANETLQS